MSGMSSFARFRSRPGDQEAFGAWYRDTYPRLFYEAFRCTFGNRAAAEDLCQDAILNFVVSGALARIDSDEAALAYLRRSVANGLVDLSRRAARESRESLPEQSTDVDTEELLDASSRYRKVIETLTPQDRALLSLLLSGASLSDIAASLGISYSNAGVRVHRIRKTINDL